MRIRLQLDAGLLMLMSLVAVVMPNAEDDGAQQHARNEENELPEAVSPCPAVPEDLGQQGMKRDEEKEAAEAASAKGSASREKLTAAQPATPPARVGSAAATHQSTARRASSPQFFRITM